MVFSPSAKLVPPTQRHELFYVNMQECAFLRPQKSQCLWKSLPATRQQKGPLPASTSSILWNQRPFDRNTATSHAVAELCAVLTRAIFGAGGIWCWSYSGAVCMCSTDLTSYSTWVVICGAFFFFRWSNHIINKYKIFFRRSKRQRNFSLFFWTS